MQGIWPFLGFDGGGVAIAIPVGGVAGALAGRFSVSSGNPRWLVLLMAVFAGSSAGAVAGKVSWGEIGEIGGQVAGGVVGGLAWAAWLFLERRKEPHFNSSGPWMCVFFIGCGCRSDLFPEGQSLRHGSANYQAQLTA